MKGVFSRTSLGVILIVGAVIRIIFLVVNLDVMTLPQGGADAVGFEREAWALSEQGRVGITHYLVSGGRFLTLIGSYVYDLTGRLPYALGGMMVIFGLGVIFLSYHAALELWEEERMARLIAWGAALFPQLVLHSVLFLREIPVSFCLAAAALCAVRYVKRNNLVYAVWFALWIVLGALFHSAVILALPAFLLGSMLARPRGTRGKVKYYAINLAAALVLIGVTYIINETGYGLNKFGGSLDEALDTFEKQELRSTLGGAAFPEWMRIRGGLSDAWKIPIRFVAFLFAPLIPFMVRSPGHLLGVVDSALYLYLFWQIYRNWGEVRENRAVVLLLVVALALFLGYSLGVSNFGTAIRHRAKMAPILILLGAGLPYLKNAARKKLHAKNLYPGQSWVVTT